MTRSLALLTAFAWWWAATTSLATSPTIESVQIGIDGVDKLGAPVRVAAEVSADPGAGPLTLTVVAPDNDGLPVAVCSAPTTGTESGLISLGVMTRLGKPNARVELRLANADGAVVARQTLRSGMKADGGVTPAALPPETRLILSIGPDGGLADALRDREAIATLPSVSEAPTVSRAYDAFDTVLITAGAEAASETVAEAGAGEDPPRSYDERLLPLVDWVRRGGRLVVACGDDAPELLAEGKPWAELAPGRFANLVPLRSTAALESFAGAQSRIRTDPPLLAARLTDITGVVAAYDGPSREALPIVIRSPFGFGEVVFLAVDLDHPAIAEWPDRAALVRALIDPPTDTDNSIDQGAPRGTRTVDVAQRLVGTLDAQLPGVASSSVLAVLVAAAAYVLLIGPGDWFLVNRMANRPRLTWFTFPLIALAAGGGAIAIGAALRGDVPRAASMAIVDIDTTSTTLRGLLVSNLYAAVAARYDLSVEGPEQLNELSWFGAPTERLGGLRSETRLSADEYAAAPSATSPRLLGLPVMAGSTKAVQAAWFGEAGKCIGARLRRTTSGLVEGQITNVGNFDIVDCQLLAGGWAWRVGDLGVGESKPINESGSLLRATTVLGKRIDEGDPLAAVAATLSFGELLRERRRVDTNVLYHHRDLTHHLRAGRAVLIGRAEPNHSVARLTEPNGALDDAVTRHAAFYRIILPVEDLPSNKTGDR